MLPRFGQGSQRSGPKFSRPVSHTANRPLSSNHFWSTPDNHSPRSPVPAPESTSRPANSCSADNIPANYALSLGTPPNRPTRLQLLYLPRAILPSCFPVYSASKADSSRYLAFCSGNFTFYCRWVGAQPISPKRKS